MLGKGMTIMRILAAIKTGFAAALVAVALILGSNPALADFEDGWKAYQKGDFATALSNWRGLAEQGDARAQFNLGNMYDEGRGVEENRQTALEW